MLEEVGYDEFYKCEYSKICLRDPIVATYQKTCNKLTDVFRNTCDYLPLRDPEEIKDVVSIIASTDVLEYLMRKNELLLINRFTALALVGITSYRQLLNESLFPRDDYLGQLAKYIVSFFPIAWSQAVLTTVDVNYEITYEHEFPFTSFSLVSRNMVSVKNIRKTLLDLAPTQDFPYKNESKFNLPELADNQHNPFMLIRKFIHTPRDRFFKYRILQGDIFTNERLHRFGLKTSPLCSYCSNGQTVETIKHLLWDCPRSQVVWRYLNCLTTYSYNYNYVSYKEVVAGSDNPIPIIENLILIGLKLVLKIDRESAITTEEFKGKIKQLFAVEKFSMHNKKDKFNIRWQKIKQFLFNDV